MGFTEHHVQHYREHGYAIAENFLSQTELNRAREEIDSFMKVISERSGNDEQNIQRLRKFMEEDDGKDFFI